MHKRLFLGVLFFVALNPIVSAQTPPSATQPAPACQTGLQKDWKRAIWRSPLHIIVSAPVAAASVIVPPLGEKYVRARIRAEQEDEARRRDTCMKAAIDLYSQTALVRAVLRMYGIRVQ